MLDHAIEVVLSLLLGTATVGLFLAVDPNVKTAVIWGVIVFVFILYVLWGNLNEWPEK